MRIPNEIEYFINYGELGRNTQQYTDYTDTYYIEKRQSLRLSTSSWPDLLQAHGCYVLQWRLYRPALNIDLVA